MKMLTVTLTGTKELLMHNEQLANPTSDIVQEMKELTAKRKKTLADHKALAEVEFRGGLYHDEKIGPYIPDRVLRAMMIGAAKKLKLGREVTENVVVLDPMPPLQYDGERSVKGLWAKKFYDQRMVGNQKVRVLRTRPKFPVGWSVTFTISFDDAQINESSVRSVVTRAETMGICDFRPLFGTFKATFGARKAEA